jgi:hypothetical protein
MIYFQTIEFFLEKQAIFYAVCKTSLTGGSDNQSTLNQQE